jgi:putative tryptophan/tyrosine transport system substrate-binding protein
MRLIGLVILSAILALAPLAVEAQPAGKVPRVVGDLTQGSPEDARSGLDAFRTALRELGYVEGETMVIEPRYKILKGAKPAISQSSNQPNSSWSSI